ncbi:NAD(P)/FAD-dependent oxidoreductase [Proteiniborus sp.]|uniref:NAD(P)/FAD-dependent oxidoreductase n=1 Tax=Proteiniborus sp. TaxID=2079015 RepID=UPI0033175FF9
MAKVKKHVIIVGGGASGILAAISARKQGADVTILERNPRIGKKILATGNGRCNFTNVNADISYYHGSNPKFAYSALSNFNVNETINFFSKIGIAPKIEEFGKVFPMSDQASSFLDVFLYELNEIGVNVICNAYVKNIKSNKGKFNIILEDGSTFQGDKVIIATGGKAMPSTGSDGNGFDLVKKLGHTIIDIFPGLVQLKLDGTFFKQIEGVKFVGTAEVLYKDKSLAKDRGDILFGNYGVSGPPIFQISRKAGELLHDNKEPILKITIMDTMSKEELKKLLVSRFENNPMKTVEFSMVGLVNKRLIPVLLKEAEIHDLKCPVANLTKKELEKILNILTDWRFKIKGTKSWPSAQVTAGGVDTKEIDQNTMESKIVKGLYFAGEIIDIDGQCGGFNLQWAWSSGFIAGRNAAI